MKSAWGIDVSKSSLKAVRLQVVQGVVELADFDVIDFPASAGRDESAFEQDFRVALNTFRGRHKIRSGCLVISPPFHAVFNRFISVSSHEVRAERLQEMIKYEVQQHLPFAIEEVIWSYQKIERAYHPGEEHEVVFFAVKRELIEQFLNLVRSSGLSVDIIQFAPVALYNYIMTDFAQPRLGKNLVVLDVGANNTNLILVEGYKFWIRNLPIVGNDITKAIQQKLDVSFEDAEKLKVVTVSKDSPEAAKIYGATQNILKDLASEMHRSIGFYKSLASRRSVNFDKILLMGNASRTIYFEEFVSQRLQIATSRLPGLTEIEFAEGVNSSDFAKKLPGLGVAIGLALQGLDRAPNKINLLPPEITKSREMARRKPFVAAIPAILIFIVIILHLGAKQTLNQLTQVNEKTAAVLNKSKNIKSTYEKMRDDTEKRKHLDTLLNIGQRRDIWIEVLNGLNRLEIFERLLIPFKGYVEQGNQDDRELVKKQEQNKMWLLEIKMKKDIKLAMVNVELVCAMVARQKSEEEFDPVGSLEFVKEYFVKALASEFKIVESSILLLDTRPVSELKTDAEAKESIWSEQAPTYCRFKINFKIPYQQ
jgi:type IV pilus assembly protein PilM